MLLTAPRVPFASAPRRAVDLRPSRAPCWCSPPACLLGTRCFLTDIVCGCAAPSTVARVWLPALGRAGSMDVLRSVSRRVRSADAFPKTLDDFRVKTASGGFVSVAALLIISVLVLSETSTFLSPERTVNISVDDVRNETLQIYINVDFPRLNCEVIGVDALDGTLVPRCAAPWVPPAVSFGAMERRRTAGCALVGCPREGGKVPAQLREGGGSEGGVRLLLGLSLLLERRLLTCVSCGLCASLFLLFFASLSLAGECDLALAMAESGNMQLEITNHMYKTRLDLSGKVIRGDKKKRVERNPVRPAVPAVKQAELPPGYCGSCYGAASEVCPARRAFMEALFRLSQSCVCTAWWGGGLWSLRVLVNRVLACWFLAYSLTIV